MAWSGEDWRSGGGATGGVGDLCIRNLNTAWIPCQLVQPQHGGLVLRRSNCATLRWPSRPLLEYHKKQTRSHVTSLCRGGKPPGRRRRCHAAGKDRAPSVRVWGLVSKPRIGVVDANVAQWRCMPVMDATTVATTGAAMATATAAAATVAAAQPHVQQLQPESSTGIDNISSSISSNSMVEVAEAAAAAALAA